MRIGLAATGRPLKLVERQLMAHRDATVPFDAIGRTADVQPSVDFDRAAKLAAIPAGESPANRGVQSLL